MVDDLDNLTKDLGFDDGYGSEEFQDASVRLSDDEMRDADTALSPSFPQPGSINPSSTRNFQQTMKNYRLPFKSQTSKTFTIPLGRSSQAQASNSRVQLIGHGQLDTDPSHGSQRGVYLRNTTELPDIYRNLFPFAVFNAMQSKCLDVTLHTDQNLVISAPTGSGKTVVFELSMIRLLQTSDQDKCVYICPTKSLCSERFRDWDKKFGSLDIACAEFTGDTVSTGPLAWSQAKKARVIVTTPEKWDALTRNWRDHDDFLSRVKLVLVDEVHILAEQRGSTLEACVSRMKVRGTAIRFILVSATIPNATDIAAWIGDHSGRDVGATVIEFGEEFRPCKLVRHVYAYPRKQQNEWQFNSFLDSKLFSVLQKHAGGKPVLVFCPTRKAVSTTAAKIMAEYNSLKNSRQNLPWPVPKRTATCFHDKTLQVLVECGVAIHHAGLQLEDRRSIEELFMNKTIQILVCTSTLAVGVNLPAHTVIIKGVHMWADSWKEYSDLDVLQMIGRAGRQQFDKEGVAIIMCESSLERKYAALTSGKTTLESSLHLNLSEDINSEICLGTISDIESAKKWLSNTFLYRRILQHPTYYQLDKGHASLQDKLDAIVEDSISKLRVDELVTDGEQGHGIISTEYGVIMAKCYMRQATMASMLKLPATASMRDLLEVLSSAVEFNDLRLRVGEKPCYIKLREDPAIRYEVKKVESVADKIMLLVQAVLGAINLNDPKFKAGEATAHLDSVCVFKHAARIVRSIIEVGIARKAAGIIKNGLELSRCIAGKTWEDGPGVLRQIKSIGPKSATTLANNNVRNPGDLRRLDPNRLEMILNRKPPFGTDVLAAVCALPQYLLNISEDCVSASEGGTRQVDVSLSITCAIASDPPTHKTRNYDIVVEGMTTILTVTSDMEFVDFRRIPTKSLKRAKTFSITAALSKPSQTINISIDSDDFAGLGVSQTYKPKLLPSEFPTRETRPQKRRTVAEHAVDTPPRVGDLSEDMTIHSSTKGSRSLSAQANPAANPRIRSTRPKSETTRKVTATTDSKLANGNFACHHSCKDKATCRHLCCREGTSKPPAKKATQLNDSRIVKSPKQPKSNISLPSKLDNDTAKMQKLHDQTQTTIRIAQGGRLTLNPSAATTRSIPVAGTHVRPSSTMHHIIQPTGEDKDDLFDITETSNTKNNESPSYTDSDIDEMIATIDTPSTTSAVNWPENGFSTTSTMTATVPIERFHSLSPPRTPPRPRKRQKLGQQLFLPSSWSGSTAQLTPGQRSPLANTVAQQRPIDEFVLDFNVFDILPEELPSAEICGSVTTNSYSSGNLVSKPTLPSVQRDEDWVNQSMADLTDGMDLESWLTDSSSIVILPSKQ